MRAEPFTPDMIDLLRLFERHRVRYLLIGGYAVHFHGHVRFTADIDFAYDPEPANSARLFDALREFWGGDIPHVADPSELSQPGMVFQFGVKPNRVDLLSQVAGVDFPEAWARRLEEQIEGLDVAVSIISLRDLRASKAAAGRFKDLDDLLNLPEG